MRVTKTSDCTSYISSYVIVERGHINQGVNCGVQDPGNRSTDVSGYTLIMFITVVLRHIIYNDTVM